VCPLGRRNHAFRKLTSRLDPSNKKLNFCFSREPKVAEEKDDGEDVPARTKVAVLMIALGQETTAEVMKYLTDFEIEQIAQSIAELDVVTTEQEDDVLEEFEQLLIAGKYVSQGGMDFARGALEKALGPRKAQGLLDRVTSTTSSGFYMLGMWIPTRSFRLYPKSTLRQSP
jgi:flagellar motor switch protein FliG